MKTHRLWIVASAVLFGPLLQTGCQSSTHLHKYTRLSGSVISVDGQPISQARINVVAPYRRMAPPALTDREGNFSLGGISSSELLLSAWAKGYKPQRIWAAHPANNVNIVLRLPSERSVYTVRVVDDAGRPVPAASVILHRRLYLQGILTEISKTNPEGIAEFSIQPSPDGLGYGIILCTRDGYDTAFNDVDDNRDCEVRLVLHRSRGHWSGKVVDTNQAPIEGARFQLIAMKQRVKGQWLNLASFPSTPREINVLARSDSKGRFLLDGISRKDYVSIAVTAPGFLGKGIVLSPGKEAPTIIQLAPALTSAVEDDV
jgi:hypothetical protein